MYAPYAPIFKNNSNIENFKNLEKNSKKNIESFKNHEDFLKKFENILKNVEKRSKEFKKMIKEDPNNIALQNVRENFLCNHGDQIGSSNCQPLDSCPASDSNGYCRQGCVHSQPVYCGGADCGCIIPGTGLYGTGRD